MLQDDVRPSSAIDRLQSKGERHVRCHLKLPPFRIRTPASAAD